MKSGSTSTQCEWVVRKDEGVMEVWYLNEDKMNLKHRRTMHCVAVLRTFILNFAPRFLIIHA